MNKYLKTQEMKEYIQNKGRSSGESAIMIWDFNIYLKKQAKINCRGNIFIRTKAIIIM